MSQTFALSTDPAAFDLGKCVQSGQVFRWKRLPDGAWLGVDGEAWFRARQDGEALLVESSQSREEFDRLFRLEEDVIPELLKRGPELEPYLAMGAGLRLMRPSCPTEALFSFLCTPNNNVVRITGMVEKLASLGDPLEEGSALRRFPTIERIAEITEEELRKAGFGYRAATIPKVASALLAQGPTYLQDLRSKPYETVHSELIALPGVGPKLADCIALFAFHKTEATPVDTHIWQAATRLYFPAWKSTPLTVAKYREVGNFMRSRFGPLAAWAQQFLFYDNLINWRSRRGAKLPPPVYTINNPRSC